jgi:hypothetical protein
MSETTITRANRSQLVFTTARGREAVFWAVAAHPQTSPAQCHHANPPRAAGIAQPEILVDTREQYPYRLAIQQVVTTRRALACGDYGITVNGRPVACGGSYRRRTRRQKASVAVVRKSLPEWRRAVASAIRRRRPASGYCLWCDKCAWRASHVRSRACAPRGPGRRGRPLPVPSHRRAGLG